MIIHAVRVKRPYPTLYHLSFNADIEGLWKPQIPDGSYEDDPSDPALYTEPSTPRISLSPTVEQCFQAVYANVKHLFADSPDRTLTFNVYRAVFNGREKLVHPSTLSKQRMVHDAHITQEHCVLTPLKMEWVSQVRVQEPSKQDQRPYYAFGDSSGEVYGWLPHAIRYNAVSSECAPPPSLNW